MIFSACHAALEQSRGRSLQISVWRLVCEIWRGERLSRSSMAELSSMKCEQQRQSTRTLDIAVQSRTLPVQKVAIRMDALLGPAERDRFLLLCQKYSFTRGSGSSTTAVFRVPSPQSTSCSSEGTAIGRGVHITPSTKRIASWRVNKKLYLCTTGL